MNQKLFKNLSIENKQKEYIVVSPDAGATKRTLKFANYMNLNTIIVHKQRNYEKENTIDNTILIGDTSNLNNKTEPFFTTFFSLSSHPPYVLPKDYITNEENNIEHESKLQHDLSLLD